MYVCMNVYLCFTLSYCQYLRYKVESFFFVCCFCTFIAHVPSRVKMYCIYGNKSVILTHVFQIYNTYVN